MELSMHMDFIKPFLGTKAMKFEMLNAAQKALFDINHDGQISAEDCPFEHGTTDAQVWWAKVMVPATKSYVTTAMKKQYGEHVVGGYKGGALVPGEIGPGQKDFQFLIDKIQVTQGLDTDSATRIALAVKNAKYGKGF
jgi:hypothetical protein